MATMELALLLLYCLNVVFGGGGGGGPGPGPGPGPPGPVYLNCSNFSGYYTVYSVQNGSYSDDHTEAHGSEFFGSYREISVLSGTMAILLVVAVVLLVEKIFHGLHNITHDTPFQDMVSAIEKELMIVGCMAFVFKIIIFTTNFLDTEWVHALELADIVIPVASFCFCVQGLLMILMSIEQCRIWSKAYHLYLEEIMDEYYEAIKLKGLRWPLRWLQLQLVKSEMEFRVFYEIFCDQYHIRRRSVDFDVYVERVFEKFLLDIITIRPLDWLLVCVLTLANWVRLLFDTSSEDGCHAHDMQCQDEADITRFTLFGAGLFVISVFLAVVSRYYERKLLNTRGVVSLEDYMVFLKYADEAPKDSVVERYLGPDQLKEILARLKTKDLQEKDDKLSVAGIVWAVVRRFVKFLIGKRHSKVGVSDLPDNPHHITSASRHRLRGIPSVYIKGAADADDDQQQHSDGQSNKRITQTSAAGMLTTAKQFAKIGEDLGKHIFWLGKPEIYFETVMAFVMILSFYLSLWLTNFLMVAARLPNYHFWISVSGVPVLTSVFVNIYIVKCAALLKAVTLMDTDAVEEVIEEAEATLALGEILRNKIMAKLRGMGSDPEKSIRELFEEIDGNGNNTLSRKEFQVFLHDLEITFSRKRWDQIFKQIDRNFDDKISLNELYLFIFPNHDQAKRAEIARIQLIRERVRNSTKVMASVNKSLHLHTERIMKRREASSNSSLSESDRLDSFSPNKAKMQYEASRPMTERTVGSSFLLTSHLENSSNHFPGGGSHNSGNGVVAFGCPERVSEAGDEEEDEASQQYVRVRAISSDHQNKREDTNTDPLFLPEETSLFVRSLPLEPNLPAGRHVDPSGKLEDV